MSDHPFKTLRTIDVSKHTEKKNGLTYLSWAWAVDQLLQADPMANWEYPTPLMYGETMMLFCSVTAFGKTMTAQLPVMDHRNQPIPNPNAFQVNTAMQRALVKAIALHGIGLYIYAGEDLPDGVNPEVQKVADEFLKALAAEEVGTTEEEQEQAKALRIYEVHTDAIKNEERYKEAWKLLEAPERRAIKTYIDMVKVKKVAA